MVPGAGIRGGVHSYGIGRPPSLSPGDSRVSRYLRLRIDNWRLAFGCVSSYSFSLSAVALLSSELTFVFIADLSGSGPSRPNEESEAPRFNL